MSRAGSGPVPRLGPLSLASVTLPMRFLGCCSNFLINTATAGASAPRTSKHQDILWQMELSEISLEIEIDLCIFTRCHPLNHPHACQCMVKIIVSFRGHSCPPLVLPGSQYSCFHLLQGQCWSKRSVSETWWEDWCRDTYWQFAVWSNCSLSLVLQLTLSSVGGTVDGALKRHHCMNTIEVVWYQCRVSSVPTIWCLITLLTCMVLGHTDQSAHPHHAAHLDRGQGALLQWCWPVHCLMWGDKLVSCPSRPRTMSIIVVLTCTRSIIVVQTCTRSIIVVLTYTLFQEGSQVSLAMTLPTKLEIEELCWWCWPVLCCRWGHQSVHPHRAAHQDRGQGAAGRLQCFCPQVRWQACCHPPQAGVLSPQQGGALQSPVWHQQHWASLHQGTAALAASLLGGLCVSVPACAIYVYVSTVVTGLLAGLCVPVPMCALYVYVSAVVAGLLAGLCVSVPVCALYVYVSAVVAGLLGGLLLSVSVYALYV